MREIYERIAEMCRQGTPGIVATVILAEGSTPRGAGAKMIVSGDGRTWGTVGGGAVEASVIGEAPSVLAEGVPKILDYDLEEGSPTGDALCGGRMHILMEPLPRTQTLCIFGAGHVSRPLAAMAKEAGFSVTVIDPRSELATRERFPQVDDIVVRDFVEAAAGLSFGPDVYLVIVTPKHEHDEAVVRATLKESSGYIGMIGSKKKVAAIVSRLRDDGFDEEVIGRLHAPIGLEIGAETPEEIAVSIVAELVAVRRGKSR